MFTSGVRTSSSMSTKLPLHVQPHGGIFMQSRASSLCIGCCGVQSGSYPVK